MRLRERRASQQVPGAVEERRRVVTGFGVHTDIIVATAEAYVSAVNALARVRSEATSGALHAPAEAHA